MIRTIKLAVVAALALGATSAFATNGSNLIGIGAKARGMGGTGIGIGHGAESGIANPALITTIKGNNEISFGGTLFMPDIETNGVDATGGMTGPLGSQKKKTSDSDTFVIPAVSLVSKFNDNFYWGIGMWGTGGLGVDYRDTAVFNGSSSFGNQMNMVTALQTMQFGVPLAYTTNGFTIGVTPIIQYSSLDVQYSFAGQSPTGPVPFSAGAGTAQDLAYGFNLGLAYEISGFTIGAVYKSEINFDIDDVLTRTISPMAVTPTSQLLASSMDEMATPEEYGIGLSYNIKGHTIAVDWKYINWEDAEVYKEFGWEDQDIFAIGYEYDAGTWAIRCGYQYAESAVQDNTGKGLVLDQGYAQNPASMGGATSLTNTFNLLGFPGTQEEHITIGGSYTFNETLSMDLAAVFGLKNNESFQNFVPMQQTTTSHSEESYSIQLNYAF